MTSYRDNSNFDPSGRTHQPTKLEWVVSGIAILVGFAMIGMAIFGESGPRWLHDLRQLPMAILMFVIASTYLIRARRNAPDEQYSPRAFRWTAALFILIGALLLAITFINSQGA